MEVHVSAFKKQNAFGGCCFDQLWQFLRQHLFNDRAEAITDLLPAHMQLAVAGTIHDFQGERDLGVRLARNPGDDTGMLRVPFRECEPFCSQLVVNSYYYRLPHARLLQVKGSDRNEQPNPDTGDEQVSVVLDRREHRQHLGLVRNVPDERLDDGVLDRERRAVRSHRKPVDPAVLHLVRERQRSIFPRTLLIGRDEEPNDVVSGRAGVGMKGSGL